jgi:hypothetical protein
MKLLPPTETEISAYRNLFRVELDKNMNNSSSSPSTDAHRIALRAFVESRNKPVQLHGSLRQNLNEQWERILPDALLVIPVTSVVGARVKEYLDAVDVVLAMTDESGEHEAIARLAASVCNVWFFG